MGGRLGENKAPARMDTDVLDWALAECAGEVAVDARDDGPFCLLSAVENRCDTRLLSDVVDSDPTHEDIRTFLGRLKTALTARGWSLVGLTTDGASRSPAPLAEVFDDVAPHICQVHLVADVVQAVLGVVASERKGLAAPQPQRPQGRPTTQAAKKAARQNNRLEQQRVDVSTHRSLCVPHPLSPSDRTRWWRITRGLPPWRTRRALMEQVYALCDRRGRTQTALDTLAQWRRRLQRCTPLGETLTKRFAPTLETALTFLDATRLPSTSHAVERGNRRYRTRQKQVDRVRTQAQIRARLALDRWREAHAEGRQQTLASLHHARAG